MGKRGDQSRILPKDSAVVLVDFANFFPPSLGEPGVSETRHLLLQLVRQVLDQVPDCGWVLIRLYGGWIQDASFSAAGSKTLQLAQLADPFPTVGPRKDRVLRGEVEVATSLLRAPRVPLGDTFRRHQGPPRLRLSTAPTPEGCPQNPEGCAARQLSAFTRSRSRICPVDGCSVTAQDAFVVNEQKMVDVMMSCDLMHLARDSSAVGVVLVTCDTDLVPALIYSAMGAKTRLVLNPTTRCWDELHADRLRQVGVVVAEGATNEA